MARVVAGSVPDQIGRSVVTAETFLRCPGAKSEIDPVTRYTLQRITACVMKI